MEGPFNKKRLTKSENFPLKLANTTKIGRQLNVKVHLISAKIVENGKSQIKLGSLIGYKSCINIQESTRPSSKAIAVAQKTFHNPSDFIEPLLDLAIPSTEAFYQHKKLLGHIPAIVDYESSIKTKQKEQHSLIKDYKLASPSKSSKDLRSKRASKSLDIDNQFKIPAPKTWTFNPKINQKKYSKINN